MFIVILIAFPLFWQSCIEDDSVGRIRELSDIEIKVERDTFYAAFMEECTIPVEVSQTKDLALEYEWRLVPLKGGSELEVVSTDLEFHHAFDELGEFRVRLKVTNSDGSSYHFFTVFVQTPYEEGLLVLSEDDRHVGRSSFLRVKHQDEIVKGNGTFITRAFEYINPEFPLKEVRDVTWYNDNIFLLTEGGKKIYVYDKKSFDFIYAFDVQEDNPGLQLRCFSQPDHPLSVGQVLMLGEDRSMWTFTYDPYFLMPDFEMYPEMKFDKLYAFFQESANSLLLNFEESYIYHQSLGRWPSNAYNSGTYFFDRNIVNLVADHEDRLRVITTDPQDPLSVRITSYDAMGKRSGFFGYTSAFLNPVDFNYQADEPLALTRKVDMLTNPKFYVTYYACGGELYEWVYGGLEPKLPKVPVLTVEGEITCMCLCPSSAKKYVYLGIWNPLAKEELKGSVYIMDAATRKIIKEYRGVADKPLKIIYKPIDETVYY